MSIRIKRVYERPGDDDGLRVLVDRLWPRGLSRQRARVDRWLKELAPSDELRKWFGHDPARWQAFRRRYTGELRAPAARAAMAELSGAAAAGNITLLYAARDEAHNNALVLREALAGLGRRRPRRAA
jgi:uncharacterized protein YeaO (DUF488 family)